MPKSCTFYIFIFCNFLLFCFVLWVKGDDYLRSLTFDDAAFEEKYDKYCDLIYKIAYQYTFNFSTAEDIMQEVFVKLFLNNRDFANETHEKAWIIRVTINLCKNSLKRRDNNYLELKDTESITGDFEQNIENNIDIIKALEKLSADERICIFLYYYEDYKISQISKALKMKENTIKSHLKRAKEKLKNELKG